jgi:hypothetical protein
MSNHFCPGHNSLYPPYLKGDSEGRPDLSGFMPQRIVAQKVIESPDISELSMTKEESSAI